MTEDQPDSIAQQHLSSGHGDTPDADTAESQLSDTQFPDATNPGQENVDTDSPRTLMSTLVYGVTLPERTARSVSAIVGGLVNETTARLIPTAFRSSRSYSTFVQQSLDMVIHDVGGVPNPNAPEASEEESKLAQKAVGGLLDVAGAATLHLSPMTVLAVFNDLAYGSGIYLRKLSDELKNEGIIDANSSIDHVSDLLDALTTTSGKAADIADTPPINVDGIRTTIAQLSNEIAKVDPKKLLPESEVARMWTEMEDVASKANVGLWDVSATMTMYALNRVSTTTRGALSTVTVAGSLFDEHIVQHYADALVEISTNGLYVTLSDAASPYLEAVWHNFDGDRDTWTEEVVTGRFFGKAWKIVRGWFSRKEAASETDQAGESKSSA